MAKLRRGHSDGLAPLFRARLGLLVALTLVVLSLALHQSYDSRPILGRWSYEFFVVLGVMFGLWVLVGALCWRAWRRDHSGQRTLAMLVDVALVCWGVAYLVSALDERENASRLLDLNFFGSVVPAAVTLEWITLTLLALAGVLWVVRREARIFLNVALSLGALSATLLFGEAIARAKAVLAPAVTGFPSYSMKIWQRQSVRLNQNGFRDGNHQIQRLPGMQRLLVIGDSYAFGWGVRDRKDRFGEQLGTMLSGATGKPWEVINASQPDRHTLEEIEFLRNSLAYQPDLVVLLYVFNDIDYLNTRFGFRPLDDRNVISEAPRTVADRLHPLRVLYWNSYLFQELFMRIRMLKWQFSTGAPPAIGVYADSAVMAVHLRDLSRFAAIADSSGAVVGIVPFEPNVTTGREAQARYDAFVERARRFGLPAWSLRGAFENHPFSALAVNAIDGHPNELANHLAAQAVCRTLVREGYIAAGAPHVLRSAETQPRHGQGVGQIPSSVASCSRGE